MLAWAGGTTADIIHQPPQINRFASNNKHGLVDMIEKPSTCNRFEATKHGAFNTPRCRGFCDRLIYPGPQFAKRVTMDMANTSSSHQICVECGYVWQDVDMVSRPDFY